mmetsp:Transcript_4327/g.8466  ORF Transcript_4327/g.8466 Transcript_4327/m.8466 type:complete len:107 (+) Transcript_4327:904-1224(+)
MPGSCPRPRVRASACGAHRFVRLTPDVASRGARLRCVGCERGEGCERGAVMCCLLPPPTLPASPLPLPELAAEDGSCVRALVLSPASISKAWIKESSRRQMIGDSP